MNMRSFPIKMATVCLVAVSLFMYGCGGGGGSSSVDDATPETDAMPGGEMPDPESTGPTQAEIDEEAMKLGAAIGLDEDGEAIDVSTGLPTGVTPSNGKIETGMDAGDFMAHDGDVAGIDGWDSDATMRTVRRVTDTIVLYSNIDAPTDVSYSDYFDTDDTNEDGRNLDGDASDSEVTLTADGEDAGRITFEENVNVSKANAGHLVFSDESSMPGTNFEIQADDTETTIRENEKVGSFFGIDGKYTCTTATTGCIVRVTSQGGLDVTGTLLFDPDEIELAGDDATLVEGVIPDPDYLVFGYWLETTTARNGDETYKLSPYAMGTLNYTAVAAGIAGTATYEGPATGKYLKKTLTTDGGTLTAGTPFSTGQFTANASLEANFGGSGIGTRDQFTVSGTVSGFMDGDTSINNNWELSLNKSVINTSTTAGWSLFETVSDTDAERTETADTHGKTSANTRHDGAWTATFHGMNAVPDGPDDDTDPDPIHPSSVAGTFNGHFQDGHVAGAFGATKE